MFVGFPVGQEPMPWQLRHRSRYSPPVPCSVIAVCTGSINRGSEPAGALLLRFGMTKMSPYLFALPCDLWHEKQDGVMLVGSPEVRAHEPDWLMTLTRRVGSATDQPLVAISTPAVG